MSEEEPQKSQINESQIADAQDMSMMQDPNVFMTQQKLEPNQPWKPFDFLFPGGKLAKLVKLTYNQKSFPFMDMLTKLKLDEGFPVVNLVGARHDFDGKTQRGKFYAGIARACFNTDAIIVDNGVTTGLEKYSLRRGCTLIGVAPEHAIAYPKLNPTKFEPNEVCNGHSHLLLMEGQNFGEEATFKVNLCKQLAQGKLSKTQGRPRCKIVNILFADTKDCFDEIRECKINKLPIIVVRGSNLCNQFIDSQHKEVIYDDKEFEDIMNDKDAHFYPVDDLNSEKIAQVLHYLLTYSPFQKLEKKDQQQQ